MRHRKSINHLGRTASHRKAMLANMAASLIIHKRIKTTTAKAKALRMYVEPLLTKSKEDSTQSRRLVFSYLQDKNAVTELFREVSPKITDRPGGYTRILKTGTRLGDSADMCIIELVDYNENLLTAKEDAKAATGRRKRRGSKKKTEEISASAPKEAIATPTQVEEVEAVVTQVEDATIGTEEVTEVTQDTAVAESEVIDNISAESNKEGEDSPESDESEENKDA